MIYIFHNILLYKTENCLLIIFQSEYFELIAQKINQLKESGEIHQPQPQLQEQNVQSNPDPIQLPYELTTFDNAEDVIATLESVGTATDGANNATNLDKLAAIERCTLALVHACQCLDGKCKITNCLKMKRVVSHTRKCKDKNYGGCAICKQLIALCCYHGKVCKDTKCPAQFCSNIKQKLKHQQKRQQPMQLAQLSENSRRTAPTGIILEPNIISAEAATQIARDMVQNMAQEIRNQNLNTSHSMQHQNQPEQSGSMPSTFEHNVISAEAAVQIARDMINNIGQPVPHSLLFQNQNQNPNTSHSIQHPNQPDQTVATATTVEFNVISPEAAIQIAHDMVQNIGQEFQNQNPNPSHSIQHQNQPVQSESTHSTLDSNNISFEAAVQITNAMVQNQNSNTSHSIHQNQPNLKCIFSKSTPGSSEAAISSLIQDMIEHTPLPNNLEHLSATPMLHVREWHGSFDMRSRNYLVQKL